MQLHLSACSRRPSATSYPGGIMTFRRPVSSMHVGACVFIVSTVLAACSGSSSGTNPPPSTTGLGCSDANQCYTGLDAAALRGQAVCLTQLQNGYCSHTCTEDSDCCAVPGECPGSHKEICAPLESAPGMYCVLSCESDDIPAGVDASTFCQQNANSIFTCRSTGGGAKNRKFCGP
jgi:hypothetical protein